MPFFWYPLTPTPLVLTTATFGPLAWTRMAWPFWTPSRGSLRMSFTEPPLIVPDALR